MLKMDNQTLLLAFVVITGAAVMLQAIILLFIYITVSKAARSVRDEVEDLRSALMPVIYNTRDLFTRLAPKVEGAVDDMVDITKGLKAQTAETQSAIAEILSRLRHQTGRIDTMMTGVLDGVDRAGGFITDAISRPVRQISGVLASVKAIVEALRAPSAPRNHARGDKDMFV